MNLLMLFYSILHLFLTSEKFKTPNRFTFVSPSLAGVRCHTRGALFLVHHVMPSHGLAVSRLWFVHCVGERSGLSRSMSCGFSEACGALQQLGSLASSRKGSSLWGASTRCLHHSGLITDRLCVGPSATR